MPWQFLNDDDRRQLAGSLAELDEFLQGQNGRRVLLNLVGLGYLLPQLTTLADNAARTFTGELIAVLENGETLSQRSDASSWARCWIISWISPTPPSPSGGAARRPSCATGWSLRKISSSGWRPLMDRRPR
jgi:hypothetical protein